MKKFPSFGISTLALAVGLVACGGSSDDFKYPDSTGSALPFVVFDKVANAEGTEIRLGGVGEYGQLL